MKSGTAIILAGGKSRRMGKDKAFVDINGEQLIARILRVLSPLFGSLVVVTNADVELDMPDARVVHDIIKDHGPLGGIHAGLTASSTEDNFVVACDMPFIAPEVIERIRELRDGADVAVPETPKGLEPLLASYSRSCLPAVEEVIEAGEKRIVSIFDKVEVRVVGMGELADLPGIDRVFTNVNTKQDLEAVLKISGGRVD